ncbi:MAG: hypothetical protein MRZ54_09225 [Clostridiales bacterium]|nr:hypothetical protein [Clostridiales bacterium]
MERISHRLIMLKPMRAGADGYARLQSEGGRTFLQIHARGLSAAAMHAYWYAGGGEACTLGEARVNERGEAALTAEAPEDGLAPERLRALIVISGGEEPVPLLIGLCAQQSAGSLLDAKNAALALCERLSRSRRSRRQQETAFPTPQVTARAARPYAQALPEKPAGKPKAAEAAPIETPPPKPAPSKPEGPPLPREIFLPAIDPLPYVTAQSRPMAEPPETGDEGEPAASTDGQDGAEPGMEAFLHPMALRRGAPAVNRLRPLAWPRGFDRLAGYFAKGMPCRLFDLPGWRFVNAAQAGGPQGLWVGVQRQDGRVSGVAYAHRGKTPPPGGRPYRAARGLDGETYQVLWQKFR